MFRIFVALLFVAYTALPCSAKIYSITDFKKSLETIISSKPSLQAYPDCCKLLKEAVSDKRNKKYTQAFTLQTLYSLKKVPQKFQLKIRIKIVESLVEGLSKNNPTFSIYDTLLLRSLTNAFRTLPSNLKSAASLKSTISPIRKYLFSHGGTSSDWEAFLHKFFPPPYIPPIPPPVS